MALVKESHIDITSMPIKNKHVIIPALTGFLFSVAVKNGRQPLKSQIIICPTS